MVRYGAKKGLASKLKQQSPHPARVASVIPVRGLNSDLPVKFAPNGGAVPGDRIVGIVSPGEGITIYPIQAPALKDFEEEPERWLDVRWDVDETNPQRFPARIRVDNVNEPGSLAQVATVIAEHDADLVCVLLDAKAGIDEEADAILGKLESVQHPKILVLNKIDLIPREKLLALAQAANARMKFEHTFMRD